MQEKPNRPSVGVPYRYRQKNAVFQAHGKLAESALVIALPKVQRNTWKSDRERDRGSQKRVYGRELHGREDARPRIDARPKKVITRAHFIRLNDRKTTGEHAIGRKLLQSERARHAPDGDVRHTSLLQGIVMRTWLNGSLERRQPSGVRLQNLGARNGSPGTLCRSSGKARANALASVKTRIL